MSEQLFNSIFILVMFFIKYLNFYPCISNIDRKSALTEQKRGNIPII